MTINQTATISAANLTNGSAANETDIQTVVKTITETISQTVDKFDVERNFDRNVYYCNSTKSVWGCRSTAIAVTNDTVFFGGRMTYEAGRYLWLKIVDKHRYSATGSLNEVMEQEFAEPDDNAYFSAMEVIGDYLYAGVSTPNIGDQKVYLFPIYQDFDIYQPKRFVLQ